MEDTTLDIAQQYDTVVKHFYHFILTTPYNGSDLKETWLSDFAGCGLTNDMFDYIADQYDMVDKNKMMYSETKNLYYKLRYQYWEKYIKQQIFNHYHIEIDKVNLPLSQIFDTIINNNSQENIDQLAQELKKPECYENPYSHTSFTPAYTPEEIQQIIKTTNNPLCYAQYTGVSLDEARKIISQRQTSHTIYKAYRPNIANYCSY